LLVPLDTPVLGSGLLARLVVDTTGVSGEVGRDLVFPLRLERAYWACTILYDDRGRVIGGSETLTDGFVRIAALPPPPSNPEPSSVVLAILGGIAFLAKLVRRGRRR
jgi:hypothetical protein